MHIIKEYTGLDFNYIRNELEIDEYRLLLKEAFIHKMMQTKEGKEYLEEAYAYEHIEANRVDERLFDSHLFDIEEEGGREC